MLRLLRICLFLLVTMYSPRVLHASPGAGGLGSGRLLPTLAALAGLTGIIIGWRARRGTNQTRAITAGVLGLVSLLTGVLHAANAAGSFGTGNGLAGALVAITLGLVSMGIGGLALVRARRTMK